MNIYLDFDNTLFNTDKLFLDIISFCRKNGIDEKYVLDARKNVIPFDINSMFKYISNYFSFDPSLPDDLDNYLSDMNKYVFDDVYPFIKELKNNNYAVHILTCGTNSWQNKKIMGTNIKKYIDDIIITQDKGNISDINYESSIFIDDNPKHLKVFLDKNAKKVIRLKRDNLFYSNHIFDDNKLIICESLDKVLEYLL